MQLTAPAILLAARAHGETAVIARMLTEQHGMVAAYVAGGRGRSLIALGCEAKHAARIVHADGFDAERGEAIEIGPGCPLCERRACPDRALPPVTRALDLHSYERTAAPYPFRRV